MSILPSWLPVPSVARARAAGRKFRQCTYEYHEAMDKYLDGRDPGAKWQDMDSVSTMMKERAEIFRRLNLSIQGRAAADLGVAWAMNANANSLVPWMIWEISRDAVLLEQIQEEIAPYVRVAQPNNEFGSAVWLAPELEHIDVDGLLTKCPLLKGAYIETLRLYTGSWAMKQTVKDMVIGERGKEQSFFVKEGTYVHSPQDLHQMDPEYYPDPKEFLPQRHIRETEDKNGKLVRTAEMGTLKPYSGGPAMCKGRAFATREMLVYPAVLLSLYEFVAPEGKGWVMPKTEKRAATRHPRTPMTVWIRRKKF
ncbi:hypothetical protein NLG97_g10554 [Lecanicillium saksenae]|uniref:Uncharacterized protein n=1 Tax=Lecanicillium saksenae TaxID=468837 RepID=A0ACC1QD34_9HYPO|nr:hypothetical protein NLG97_g10554 [Lecanicillium saksenae]